MNNKQKGLAGICIFLILFSGGWYANEFNNRTIHEKGLDQPDAFNVQQVDDHHIIEPMAPFQPREYIRIGNRVPN
ncbi:hypothetical protein [Halalkalibacter krulwichiae]|uniref:Uncharacterized protein n=1 Tax=Halalkalibacter krulwichiae TaxID=199441 RepID=A0A1X9M793_9BACI|nr:hypothetical protein [Halalkalibacter krulwichiae]ARK29287.1 hypothetical protein BkAM31D_05135 [Halalkalibacter krulwichiae]